jgi:hypothetical protein
MPNQNQGQHSHIGGKSLVNETEFAAKLKGAAGAKKKSGGGLGAIDDRTKIIVALVCIAIAAVLGMWQYGLFGGKLTPGAGVAEPSAVVTSTAPAGGSGGSTGGAAPTTPTTPDASAMTLPNTPPASIGGELTLPGARPR